MYIEVSFCSKSAIRPSSRSAALTWRWLSLSTSISTSSLFSFFFLLLLLVVVAVYLAKVDPLGRLVEDAVLGRYYVSNATCLIRLIGFAASFAAFEESVHYTSSVRRVVPPDVPQAVAALHLLGPVRGAARDLVELLALRRAAPGLIVIIIVIVIEMILAIATVIVMIVVLIIVIVIRAW